MAQRRDRAHRDRHMRPYLRTLHQVSEDNPGLIEAANATLQEEYERWHTTSGAVVREFPTTRDQGVQTNTRGIRRWARGTQTLIAGVRRRTTATQTTTAGWRRRTQGTQTCGPTLMDRATQTGETERTITARPTHSGHLSPRRPRREERHPRQGTRPATASTSRHSRSPTPAARTEPGTTIPTIINGCWTCGSTAHRRSQCTRAQTRLYCYRCGRADVTVKDCPTCHEYWARDREQYERILRQVNQSQSQQRE